MPGSFAMARKPSPPRERALRRRPRSDGRRWRAGGPRPVRSRGAVMAVGRGSVLVEGAVIAMRAFRKGAVPLLVAAIVMAGGPAVAGGGPIWHRAPGGRLAALTIARPGDLYVTGSIRGKHGDALMITSTGSRAPGWRGRGEPGRGLGRHRDRPRDRGPRLRAGVQQLGTGEGRAWLRSGDRRARSAGSSEAARDVIVAGVAARPRGGRDRRRHGCCDIAAEREGYL